ncbi:hypothetical protein [Alloscardovia theropitheci]|nr:hypothetical protein [Alloscardovia theropitheci]
MASEQERAMIAQLEYDKRLDNPNAMHKPVTYGTHNEKNFGYFGSGGG